MWPNLQFLADLVAFIEEILNRKLHFLCIVLIWTLLLRVASYFTVQFWVFTSTVTYFVVNTKDLAMYIRLSSSEYFSKFKAAPKGNIDFEQ